MPNIVINWVKQQAISWANIDPDLCRHMVSLGHNELTHAQICWLPWELAAAASLTTQNDISGPHCCCKLLQVTHINELWQDGLYSRD